MAHMFFQRIATEIREAYAARDDAESRLEEAGAFRRWAQDLAVDAATRASLIEPIVAVEDGLREVLRRRASGPGPD